MPQMGNDEDDKRHDSLATETAPATRGYSGARSGRGDRHAWELHGVERYEILGEHGRGGIGRVLSATDRQTERVVAIKELLSRDALAEQRFKREALLTAQLEHPGIVPIYELGLGEDGRPFYAMKMIEGKTLRTLIAEASDLPARLELAQHVIAAADAVGFAHSRDVVHRDLKPANIVVGAHGETVVIDWGLAKRLTDADLPHDDAEPLDADEQLTRVGSVIGTPAFMSPEQAAGEAVDPRADVYALGAILYNIVAGAPPFDGRSSPEVIEAVKRQDLPDLRAHIPDAPAELVAIIKKAMSTTADARYASASDLAKDLSRLRTGQLVGAHHYTFTNLLGRWARAHRAAVAIATLAIVAAIAGTAISFDRITKSRDQADAKRVEAEQAREQASKSTATLLERQGRLEMEAGRPFRAAAFFEAALEEQPDDVVQVLLNETHRLGRRLVTEWNTGDTNVKGGVFTTDGSTLVTAGGTPRARVWALTGVPLAGPEFDGPVFSVGSSADGEVFAVGTNQVSLWDRNWASLGNLDPKPAPELARKAITKLRFGPTDQLYVARWDTVEAWNYRTRTQLWSLRLDNRIGGMAFSSKTGQLAVGTYGGQFVVLNSSDGSVIRRSNDGEMVFALSFSPDGKLLAMGGYGGYLRLLFVSELGSPQAEQRRFKIPGDTDIKAVAFSPSGRTLAAVGKDGILREYPWFGGPPLAEIDAHPSGSIRDVAYAPDGRTLATFGDDGFVRLWASFEFGDRRMPEAMDDGTFGETGAFSPNGASVASSGLDGSLTLYDAATFTQIWRVTAGRVEAWDVRFSADGRYILTSFGSDEQERGAKLWSATSGELVRTFEPRQNWASWACDISRDNKEIACIARDVTDANDSREVVVWSVGGGGSRTIEQYASAISFDPVSDQLVLADRGEIIVCEVRDCTKRRSLTAHSTTIHGIRYSADGKRVLTFAWDDHLAKVWDREFREIHSLRGHWHRLMAGTLNADGRLAVTRSLDGTVRVWDVQAGAEIRRIGAHGGVAFSPDSMQVLTTGPLMIHGLATSSSGDELRALTWSVVDGELIQKSDAK